MFSGTGTLSQAVGCIEHNITLYDYLYRARYDGVYLTSCCDTPN